MEPRVTSDVLRRSMKNRKNWSYDQSRVVHGASGSGNNWACGYFKHSCSLIPGVVDGVRKEMEAADHCGGLMMLQSLAGGTGSGVGAAVTEALRDEFPGTFCVNCVVWPYASGEVVVESYNAVLTLAHLYSASDALLCVENEVCCGLYGLTFSTL